MFYGKPCRRQRGERTSKASAGMQRCVGKARKDRRLVPNNREPSVAYACYWQPTCRLHSCCLGSFCPPAELGGHVSPQCVVRLHITFSRGPRSCRLRQVLAFRMNNCCAPPVSYGSGKPWTQVTNTSDAVLCMQVKVTSALNLCIRDWVFGRPTRRAWSKGKCTSRQTCFPAATELCRRSAGPLSEPIAAYSPRGENRFLASSSEA